MGYRRKLSQVQPKPKIELYRGLRNPDWINPKTGRIVRAAYHLRESERDGLSVGIVSEWQGHHDFRVNGPLDPCYGVLGLSTEHFDELGLSVKSKKNAKQQDKSLGVVNSAYPNKFTDAERANEVADILIEDSVIILKPNTSK